MCSWTVRELLLGIAIGQDQHAHSFGIERCENLRNAASPIVANYFRLIDPQPISPDGVLTPQTAEVDVLLMD